MKLKILFYGNCQTGTVSRFFSKNEKLKESFEIIKCDESCAPMNIWRGDKTNFAVWTKENQPIQKEIYKSVHEKLKQADIFIFTSTEITPITELKTEYLCENISSGMNICLPNVRLFLYCSDWVSLKPYIEYARTKVKDKNNINEIASFIRDSDDTGLINILERDYPICTDFERYRNENALRAKEDSVKYNNYICMESFVKENYKTTLLAYQHNHPSKKYYIGLISKILNSLSLKDIDIKEEDIEAAGYGQPMVNSKKFKFFNNYFPNLEFTGFKNEIPIEAAITEFLQKTNETRNI
jgi:hypothetical protein